MMATAISYTGSRLSLNKYFPISVKAAAESMASRPTRFRSKYGVASLPYENLKINIMHVHIKSILNFCFIAAVATQSNILCYQNRKLCDDDVDAAGMLRKIYYITTRQL